MPTSKQLRMIHVAKRQLCLDDAAYREVLRAHAGVASSKDLNARGLENVMSQFEHMGFRASGGCRGAEKPADYWRSRKFHRGITPDPRQVHLIHQLASKSRYLLPSLCKRFSGGRVDQPEQLVPREAHALIEMLKASGNRNKAKEMAESPLLPF